MEFAHDFGEQRPADVVTEPEDKKAEISEEDVGPDHAGILKATTLLSKEYDSFTYECEGFSEAFPIGLPKSARGP